MFSFLDKLFLGFSLSLHAHDAHDEPTEAKTKNIMALTALIHHKVSSARESYIKNMMLCHSTRAITAVLSTVVCRGGDKAILYFLAVITSRT